MASDMAFPFPILYDLRGSNACALVVEISTETLSAPVAVVPPFDTTQPIGVAQAALRARMENDLQAYRTLTVPAEGLEEEFFFDHEHIYGPWARSGATPAVDAIGYMRRVQLFRTRIDPVVDTISVVSLAIDISQIPPKKLESLSFFHSLAATLLRGWGYGNAEYQPLGAYSREHTITISESLGPVVAGHDEVMRFHFDGAIPTWGATVFEDSQFVIENTPPDASVRYGDLIKFYRDTMLILTEIPMEVDFMDSGPAKALKSRLTDGAREHLPKILTSEPRVWYQRYQILPFNRIVFILDADPFYLVLTSNDPEKPNEISNGILMVKTGDTYRWSNLGLFTNLYELVQMEEFAQKLDIIIGELQQTP
jgi:hypothetical protein